MLWIPIKGWMPEELKKHQWLNDSLPTKYRTHGLRQLMRIFQIPRRVCKEFVTLFANMVIAAAEGPPLQPLAVVPDIGDVPNAFRKRQWLRDRGRGWVKDDHRR